jgi:hypothetical protein
MVFLAYDVHHEMAFAENKQSKMRKSRKARKDHTKSHEARIQSKARRYMFNATPKYEALQFDDVSVSPCTTAINQKQQISRFKQYFTKLPKLFRSPTPKPTPTPICAQEHNYIDWYLSKNDYDVNKVLFEVLTDWALNHSTRLPPNLQKEHEYKLMADELVTKRNADVNDPRLIRGLYKQVRALTDHWYYPVKEIEYLLSMGGNAATMLSHLWALSPAFTLERFHDYKCEISVLLEAANIKVLNSHQHHLIFTYVTCPWESNYKMDFILDPCVDDMTHDSIANSIQTMFKQFVKPNTYLLEYLIDKGVDPNGNNGQCLRYAILDYINLHAQYPDLGFYRRYVMYRRCEQDVNSHYDESNCYKLSWLVVIILIKRCAFEHVISVANMVDETVTRYHEHIKTLINILRPNVGYKREWAARCIQSAWRRAISNPQYTICKNRLQKEFDSLESIS